MILFVGDLDRADRDREGFQEVDFPAFFAPDRQMGGADRRCAADPRICRPRLARRHRRPPRPGGARASPRTCCATRSRRSTARASPPVAETPRPRRDRGAVRPAQGRRPPRSRSSAAPTGARARRIISPISPSATASPPPPPSAARTRSPTAAGSMPASSATAPTRSCSSASATPTCCIVVGARLGEATTDGYKLVTPDHPGQILVHVHPDPNELGRVYHADLPICADMGEFAEMARRLERPRPGPLLGRRGSAPRMARMVRAQAARRRQARPRPVRQGDARRAPRQHDHLQRRGQFLRLVAPLLALWRDADPARPDQRARWATACPPRSPPRFASRTGTVVCVAGDGDFLMNGQELATAAQYGADLLVILVDNGAYGTIRMHQERDYPARISAHRPRQPRFRQAGRGLWRLGRAGRDHRRLRPRARSGDGAQGHPPDPLHHRRRGDHQPDDDREIARQLGHSGSRPGRRNGSPAQQWAELVEQIA